MVAVHFRLSSFGTVELDLHKPVTWEHLFSRCTSGKGLEQKGTIAVRDGRILHSDDLVANADVIHVFPAISGG